MSADTAIWQVVDSVTLENGVLTISYMVFYESGETGGRYCADTKVQWFEGAEADEELARNDEARNYLVSQIEAQLAGDPALASYRPTFELADNSRKTIDKF